MTLEKLLVTDAQTLLDGGTSLSFRESVESERRLVQIQRQLYETNQLQHICKFVRLLMIQSIFPVMFSMVLYSLRRC